MGSGRGSAAECLRYFFPACATRPVKLMTEREKETEKTNRHEAHGYAIFAWFDFLLTGRSAVVFQMIDTRGAAWIACKSTFFVLIRGKCITS
jgi:hypothetical protein